MKFIWGVIAGLALALLIFAVIGISTGMFNSAVIPLHHSIPFVEGIG